MKRGPQNRAADLCSAALLFGISAAVCRHLFFTDYIDQMGAGDGPLIAMARYTMRHWGDLAWWPIWFAGMPFQNVYGPLAHLPVAAAAALSRQSPAWVLHTLGAVLYCLGPVALWWAVLRLSGSRMWALAAAALFAVTSPAAILIPSIRADVGGALHFRRLYDMVVYGEYPHVAVVSVTPVALVLLDRMMRGRRAWIAVAAAALACFGASSVTGSAGFAIVSLAWLLALPVRDYGTAFWKLGAAACLAYALAMPWLPPSTVRLILFNAQWGTGRPTPFTGRNIIYLILIAGAAAGIRYGMRRAPELFRFAALLTFFCGIIMAADLAGGVAVVPQPYRFQLEFELGCCVLLGLVWVKTAGRLPPHLQLAAGGAVVLVLAAVNAAHAGRYIQRIDVRQTVEYQAAQWFDRNMAGGRVFAPGSVSYWMNVFTDTPQLGGCCDQGVPSWEERVALYSIYTGQNMGAREGPVSLVWLQAYGVQAVEVTGPGGREVYKPYVNPRKFEGLLPALWRSGGDVIYRVPQRSNSLAHVMRPDQVIAVAERPKDGLDTARLEQYVAALEDPSLPDAPMRWMGQSHARIVTSARPEQVISVQVSYDRGWHARAAGKEIPVTSDGLGLMVLYPRCSGPCTVDLQYEEGEEMRVARWCRAGALLICIALAASGLGKFRKAYR